MSGYRSLHRETVGSYPIWNTATSPVLGKSKAQAPKWRIFTACGDGLVRAYLVQEKSLETQKDVLDASACTCRATHVLLGKGQEAHQTTALGCTQVEVARNYVGDDDMAGDLLVVSMDLAGKVRIWQLPEDMDKNPPLSESTEVSLLSAVSEFTVENATGTCMKIVPPLVSGLGDVYSHLCRHWYRHSQGDQRPNGSRNGGRNMVQTGSHCHESGVASYQKALGDRTTRWIGGNCGGKAPSTSGLP
jgi:hypothetical protein